ncbi:histidine kinase [Flavihumibacter sp. RY-1]|uniref:Histidine kinase n=1 Tax=Flavihumibacter fluminis TaxID=2909236 RepID=A0ABS9BDB1_9BACT|nr:histidine kinase [Flavihumibacter fluminis]
MGELLVWSGFCSLFLLFYFFILTYNASGKTTDTAHFISAVGIELIVSYAVRIGIIAVLWWFYFRKLKDRSVSATIWLHLLTVSIYLLLGGILPYKLLEAGGMEMKIGRSMLWMDIALPYIFYVIQFSGFYAYFFWCRSQQQIKKEKELLSLAYQAEVGALKAQIQPHFLFNTLNSISATVLPEQEATRILIAKLADTFRYALRSTREDLVPLASELQFIENYLALEKERFTHRLQVEILADETVTDAAIPPMLLQPLVENAIKHGIGPSKTGGKIKIACRESHGFVVIYVSDSGIGYEGDLSAMTKFGGIGLRNTMLRLEKLYNEKIQISRHKPSGLIFSFKIPIHYYASRNSIDYR